MSRSSDLVPVEPDDLELVEEERSLADQQAEVAAEIADAAADLARLSREVSEFRVSDPSAESGTALVPAKGSASMAKKRLAGLRAEATKQAGKIERKQGEIREKQREIEKLMRKQMGLAEQVLEPLQKYVARLEEGIWMVNLYLGRNEQIVLLHDGEPAPADVPVAIRQMVLAMDEECAVDPEGGGIDATNIEAFDEWLKEDWSHVEQVLPNEKGVVALRPRFESKRYEDPWKQQAVAEADRKTYFLIRNGGKVYRTWTDFHTGARLVPQADEFASYFYEEHREWNIGKPDNVHRIPITPGTRAWEEAEEKSDAQQRHYMRVGLILQGLVDRTTVFHPLPDGGINFLDFDHHGGSWEFVIDAENLLTTGRPKFYDWLRELNAQLTVGMRVVGAFRKSYRRDDDEWAGRVWPRGAELPPTGELLVIEEQPSPGEFVVRYPRTEKIYDPKLWVPSEDRPGWGHYGDYKTPKQRASCVLDPGMRNLIPFDLVTEEEMVEYLNARLDRHAYTDMFPLLKAAIKAKRAEREEEAPFRMMLAGVLARENGVEVADAEGALDSLVEWWKLTNKSHRPLVGDEQSQAKAVRMIVAEHGRRMKAARADVNVAGPLLIQHPDALLIARKRDNKYVVLTPENAQNVFVAEREYGARGRPSGEPKRWRLMPPKVRRARWQIAYQAERFDGWDFNASLNDHLTGPEFDRLRGEVMAGLPATTLAVGYDAEAREFHTWRLARGAKFDADYPLSGKLLEPEVKHFERKWQRKGGEAVLRGESRSWRSEFSDQRQPWDTRSREGAKWHPRERNRYELLFVDDQLVARYQDELAKYKAADTRRDALRKVAHGLLDSIKQQWVERREQEEYATFLEDFLDPELWEGHRKLLPPGTFDYPYRHWNGRGFDTDKPDALAGLVLYAVEQEIDLNGLTVRAAIEHFPPAAFFGVPKQWEQFNASDSTFSTKREQLPEAADIPDDLRDLRFMRPFEPEPDDADDADD